MKSERMLITGGAGFIGANFVRYWRGRYPQARLVVLDALTYAGNRESLAGLEDDPGFRFVEGDICDGDLVLDLLRDERLDTIVHFAAESHVDRSIHGPDPFVTTNIVGTHALLKAARSAWLDGAVSPHLFHHVSTDEVFGSLEQDDPAFHERTPYDPSSPYSASKAASDHLVRAYHRTYGLRATLSNCSNNYGPYQFPEKLIPLMIINVLEGKPLPVYGDGGNVRDWLFVDDHCRGIELILERGRAGQTYNIGSRTERSNIELVRLLCRLLDEAFARQPELAGRFPACPAAGGASAATLIGFVPDRPGHDRRYAIDPARAERELGYRSQATLESGLARTLDWYLANESWWRRLMDDSYQDWIRRQYSERGTT